MFNFFKKKSKNHLQLIIPRLSNEEIIELYPNSLWKSLFKKSTQISTEDKGIDATLWRLFGFEKIKCVPVALLEAWYRGWDPLASSEWLRCDPVSFQVDHQGAFLLGRDENGLSENESIALAEVVQSLLPDGMILRRNSLVEWHIQSSQALQIETENYWEVLGKDIRERLPKGPRKLFWHRLWTEIQMAFYSHPVNQKRRAEGVSEIGGVWFWGEGTVKKESFQTKKEPSSLGKIVSDYFFAKVLADNVQAICVPLNQIQKKLDEKINLVVIIPNVYLTNQSEPQWMEWILDQISKKMWDTVTFNFCNGIGWSIKL